MHANEVRQRRDRYGGHLISDVLPYGRLSYVESNAISDAIGFEKFRAC
jgi:hypothetical protein